MDLTVGFDLDMTLIDSRPGIKAIYDMLSAETGVPIDSDLVISRLGPPLEVELANWFPPDAVAAVADRYRQLYAAHGVESATAMPGAYGALDAVRRGGGRTIVVTGKHGPNAKLNLDALRLEVDAVFGSVWGPDKGEVLREQHATIYVGDHLGDILGGKAADAVAVGVATGPYDANQLADAGADVVLASLTEFPDWFAGHPH